MGKTTPNIDVVRQHVALERNLTGEQRERIVRTAQQCLVHRLLESALQIEDDLGVVG